MRHDKHCERAPHDRQCRCLERRHNPGLIGIAPSADFEPPLMALDSLPAEDDEEFCPMCFVGITSSEHHEKCVRPLERVDDLVALLGQAASALNVAIAYANGDLPIATVEADDEIEGCRITLDDLRAALATIPHKFDDGCEISKQSAEGDDLPRWEAELLHRQSHQADEPQ